MVDRVDVVDGNCGVAYCHAKVTILCVSGRIGAQAARRTPATQMISSPARTTGMRWRSPRGMCASVKMSWSFLAAVAPKGVMRSPGCQVRTVRAGGMESAANATTSASRERASAGAASGAETVACSSPPSSGKARAGQVCQDQLRGGIAVSAASVRTMRTLSRVN